MRGPHQTHRHVRYQGDGFGWKFGGPVSGPGVPDRQADTIAGKDEKGRYRVDTADALSDLISRFLQEKDFDAFARNQNNY